MFGEGKQIESEEYLNKIIRKQRSIYDEIAKNYEKFSEILGKINDNSSNNFGTRNDIEDLEEIIPQIEITPETSDKIIQEIKSYDMLKNRVRASISHPNNINDDFFQSCINKINTFSFKTSFLEIFKRAAIQQDKESCLMKLKEELKIKKRSDFRDSYFDGFMENDYDARSIIKIPIRQNKKEC